MSVFSCLPAAPLAHESKAYNLGDVLRKNGTLKKKEWHEWHGEHNNAAICIAGEGQEWPCVLCHHAALDLRFVRCFTGMRQQRRRRHRSSASHDIAADRYGGAARMISGLLRSEKCLPVPRRTT